MKIDPACFPCILRRLLSCASQVTDDSWLQHKVLGKAMTELADTPRESTPAEAMSDMVGVISKMLGSTDLLQKAREQWFQELGGVRDALAEAIAGASDSLLTALAFSARANVFDDETLTAKAVREDLGRLGLKGGDAPCDELTVKDDYDRFLKDLDGAETLLFLHDSGPELIVDRLLIEELARRRPGLRVTSVVRKEPILLDATHEDAEQVGLGDLEAVTQVIDPGIRALGVPLNECVRDFRETFEASDVVLAKGQAHFETLEDSGRKVYYVLRVKCAVMARNQGAKVGDTLIFRG